MAEEPEENPIQTEEDDQQALTKADIPGLVEQVVRALKRSRDDEGGGREGEEAK